MRPANVCYRKATSSTHGSSRNKGHRAIMQPRLPARAAGGWEGAREAEARRGLVLGTPSPNVTPGTCSGLLAGSTWGASLRGAAGPRGRCLPVMRGPGAGQPGVEVASSPHVSTRVSPPTHAPFTPSCWGQRRDGDGTAGCRAHHLPPQNCGAGQGSLSPFLMHRHTGTHGSPVPTTEPSPACPLLSPCAAAAGEQRQGDGRHPPSSPPHWGMGKSLGA